MTPLIVDVVRGGVVESRHAFDVAVVDDAGDLIGSLGDPNIVAAFRSSAKPIQCRTSLDAGWAPADQRSVAIACASHNGERAHIEAVRSLLGDAGVDEDLLACPAHLPGYIPALIADPVERRIAHNCSGKHAAMLAACAAAGWPLVGYRASDHPLQRAVLAAMTSLLGVEPRTATDGCGAPTYFGPLHAFARAFRAIDDGPEMAAMRAHPHLVAGTQRLDTDLMTAAPRVVSKVGAEGLACISGGGLGIAVKARDGDLRSRAVGVAAIGVARSLGLLDGVALVAVHEHPVVLGGGEPAGEVRLANPVRLDR